MIMVAEIRESRKSLLIIFFNQIRYESNTITIGRNLSIRIYISDQEMNGEYFDILQKYKIEPTSSYYIYIYIYLSRYVVKKTKFVLFFLVSNGNPLSCSMSWEGKKKEV